MNDTVYNFLDIFCDPELQEVLVYGLTSEKELFCGTRDEMPEDVQELEVMSIDCLDNTKVLTINVEA